VLITHVNDSYFLFFSALHCPDQDLGEFIDEIENLQKLHKNLHLEVDQTAINFRLTAEGLDLAI
jgi:hypothetical protein